LFQDNFLVAGEQRRIDAQLRILRTWNAFGPGAGETKGVNVEAAQEIQMTVVRILIVDDFDLWKGFVAARLRERRNLEIVGFAADGLKAVQMAEELRPDLILLDMMLPKLNGIEAARQMRRVAPLSKILFVSSETDLETVRRGFEAGGRGYISKMDAAEELLEGIESVLRGERFVSTGVADSGMLNGLQDTDPEDSDSEDGDSEDENTPT
jgi:DNA-binding NarL/FixJ family response regulator